MADVARAQVVVRRTRRLPIGLLIGVVLFCFAAPIALRQRSSYDGRIMERVAVALADHLDPLVHQTDDEFKLNTPYSNYGLGTSVVMAPLHWVDRAVGDDSGHATKADHGPADVAAVLRPHRPCDVRLVALPIQVTSHSNAVYRAPT